MAIMPREVRDLYLYFVGMDGNEIDLHRIQKEFKHPDIWYKGNILECATMVQFLKHIEALTAK